MNVKTFKVLGGEELIANVIHVGDRFVVAADVVVLQFMQHPETGKPVKAYGDYPALAKLGQDISFPITSLLTMPVDAHEELERQYVANVTGLELPPATPKILLS